MRPPASEREGSKCAVIHRHLTPEGLFRRVLRRSPGVTETEICNGHNIYCETRVRTGRILFHSDIGVAFDRWSDLGADPRGAIDPVLQQILIARDGFSGLCSGPDCLSLSLV
jgi:hypothetical protein